MIHFGIVNMPMLDGSFSYALGIQSRSGILFDWQEDGRQVRGHESRTRSPDRSRMDVHAALISTESSVDSAALA